MRLFTRNGHDWSGRFPLITEAALPNRNSSFVLDGEDVLLGVGGISDFNRLHSRKHHAEVEFYAFDILVSDGEDLRRLPLSMRKANLSRLLARRVDGIFLSDFEQGEIGPDLFRQRLFDGTGGPGLQAPRECLPRRSIAALDQGQEPAASGVQSGAGSVLNAAVLDVRRSERWANGSGCMSSRTSMMLEKDIKLHRFAGISPEHSFTETGRHRETVVAAD